MKLLKEVLLRQDGAEDRPAPRAALRRIVTGCVAAAVLMSAPAAQAEPVSQPAGLALGVSLGLPTGFSMKQWFGGANAWDLGVGVGPGLRVHADFLFGIAQVLSDKTDLTLDLYIGVGPILGVTSVWCGHAIGPNDKCGDGRVYAGARVPFGIDFRLARAPVEFGLEVAPGIWLAPSFVSGLLDALVFVRFVL